MACQYCSGEIPANARFCPQCGANLAPPPLYGKPQSSLTALGLSLLISLAVTILLSMVFHIPIFILGAFLPLFWRGRR